MKKRSSEKHIILAHPFEINNKIHKIRKQKSELRTVNDYGWILVPSAHKWCMNLGTSSSFHFHHIPHQSFATGNSKLWVISHSTTPWHSSKHIYSSYVGRLVLLHFTPLVYKHCVVNRLTCHSDNTPKASKSLCNLKISTACMRRWWVSLMPRESLEYNSVRRYWVEVTYILPPPLCQA